MLIDNKDWDPVSKFHLSILILVDFMAMYKDIGPMGRTAITNIK